MPPENLPTIENMENNHNNHESDWWIFDKISQNESYQEFINNRFFKPFQTDNWWNFSLAIKAILILICIASIFAYQNRIAIFNTFPNTIAVVQKVNIIPELFTKVGFDLESRYSLSSILISSENSKPENLPITVNENTLTEKPIKVLINKLGIKSPVINPISTSLTTLNNSLKLGAVRYPDSGSLGEDKSVFIFGHSTSLATDKDYYKTFNNLDKLVAGDEIILQSANNEYIYKVTSTAITNTEEGLVQLSNDKELILSTCNTLGQKEERIVVKADFIKSRSLKKESSTTPATPVTPQAGTGQTSTYEVTTSPTEIDSPTGRIDFLASIDAIGILGDDNQFIASSTPNANDKIAVKFTVKNIGNKKSESWYFNAVLPTSPFHIFHSRSQRALAPGEKIEFTMGFDKPKIGENQLVIINVDPTGGIKESDKTNNIVKEFITIVE